MREMLVSILKPLSFLPLRVVHGIGAFLGLILFHTATRLKQRAQSNMTQSNLFSQADMPHALRENFGHIGKAILETLYIWQISHRKIRHLVKEVEGWELVEEAIATGKGLIFITPHMGCFEITSLYYALHHPISVLYRPPKLKWLTPMIKSGREKHNVTLAPANLVGVKTLMQALKRGEAIGILPDQIPYEGEGEWAPFFGKPAYTMLLASKLAEKSGAMVIMAFGKRLESGEGFGLYLTKIESIATPSLLNQALEAQIAKCPTQYYWNYHRYKVSRKAKPLK